MSKPIGPYFHPGKAYKRRKAPPTFPAPLVEMSHSNLPPLPIINDPGLDVLSRTHRSMTDPLDYRQAVNVVTQRANFKRLEWVGDGWLQGVIARILVKMYPLVGTGVLASARDTLKANITLAHFARHYDLSSTLIVTDMARANWEHMHDEVLADAFEARLGGLWVEADEVLSGEEKLRALEAMDVWAAGAFSEAVFPQLRTFVMNAKVLSGKVVNAKVPRTPLSLVPRTKRKKLMEGDVANHGNFDLKDEDDPKETSSADPPTSPTSRVASSSPPPSSPPHPAESSPPSSPSGSTKILIISIPNPSPTSTTRVPSTYPIPSTSSPPSLSETSNNEDATPPHRNPATSTHHASSTLPTRRARITHRLPSKPLCALNELPVGVWVVVQTCV